MRSAKLRSIRWYELEAGACQGRDNVFCNLQRLPGIHPYVYDARGLRISPQRVLNSLGMDRP